MSDWIIPGILMMVASLVMITTGVRLVTGRIGRNRIYGYRVNSTFQDVNVWYPVNALSGIWLIWAGLLSLVIGILLIIFRNREDTVQLVMLIGVPALLICVMVGVYRGWRIASSIDKRLHDEEA